MDTIEVQELARFEALSDEERAGLNVHRRTLMPQAILYLVQGRRVSLDALEQELLWMESEKHRVSEQRMLMEVLLGMMDLRQIAYQDGYVMLP